MGRRTSVILCQPDERRGCSACCGLFNLGDLSRSALTRYLMGAERRLDSPRPDDESVSLPGGEPVRDTGSHICPYQGFLDGNPARPGCLLHPLHRGEDLRNRSLFGSTICANYLCPAHYIFTDEHARILVEYVEDWYLYSIAIIDPESFVWMVDTLVGKIEIKLGGSDIAVLRRMLIRALEIHAENLARLRAPVFHYALSEYLAHRGVYSLAAPGDAAGDEKARIIDECARLCL
ncbi:MAG: hypothetical protein EPN93_04995 [Spirochaetes bacterium]|nr:MAG: hypothetical protein EPN93_04995 [Spirochaetota bacterium]